MSQSIFNVEAIARELSEGEKNKLRAIPVQTLQQWSKAMSYAQEMEPIFGPKPRVPNPEWWAFMRKECMKAVSERKSASAVVAGSVMQSAWQGKVELSLEAKKEGIAELVIKSQDKEIHTGVGPILALTEVSRCVQRPLFLAASFATESVTKGLMCHADSKLAERMVNVSIPEVGAIVANIATASHQASLVSENLSGVKLIDKMARAMSVASKADQATLSSVTAAKVLKDCTIDKETTRKIGGITNYPMGKVEQKSKGHLVQVKDGDRWLHVWMGNKAVNLKFAVPSNPKKGEGSLGKSLSWIEHATSLLGGTNIKALASSAGLCPGLEKSEADIIRFVTVAMKAYEDHESITVWGTSPMMPLLYYSLLEYEKKKNKLSQSNAESRIKLKVHYVQGGMKTTVASEPSRYFTYTDKPVGFVVAWFPKETASAGNSQDTLSVHREKYSLWTKFIGKSEFAIFREVLEQEYYIFRDGLPSLFNYWQTTKKKLAAMTFKNGQYEEELLQEVQDVYATSFDFAKKLIVLPFCPPVMRSYRILAVKGSKKLDIREDDDGIVVATDFGMVQLEEGYDGQCEEEQELSYEEDDPEPEVSQEQKTAGTTQGQKTDYEIPISRLKAMKTRSRIEEEPRGLPPESSLREKEKEEEDEVGDYVDLDATM